MGHDITFDCYIEKVNSRNFDLQGTGMISKSMFLQLMKTKQVPEEDVQEMLEGKKDTFEFIDPSYLIDAECQNRNWM